MTQPNWIGVGPNLNINSECISIYVEFLLKYYNENNQRKLTKENKKWEEILWEYTTEHLIHNKGFFWMAIGYAIAKNKSTCMVETPHLLLFKELVKLKIWEHATKNNFLKTPYNEKEFVDYTGIK